MQVFMKRIYLFLVLIFGLSVLSAQAQNWDELLTDPDANFYDIQAKFNTYWEGKDFTEKGKGWKPFKRWEWFVEQRVYPSGDMRQMDVAMAAYLEQWLASPNTRSSEDQATWTFMGPSDIPVGGGAGRCNFLRFDPQDPNILWTGSPGGGLWKSANAGASWVNWHTDHLPVIGCTDIAIHPENSDIMYLATGDGYGNDTYSIGVLKSTDGGFTWSPTGLTWEVTLARRIRRLLIHPHNPEILIAGTSNGVYLTEDGGHTWSRPQSGNVYDLEFKPDDPSVIYASSNAFFRSTDTGQSWQLIQDGLQSNTPVRRIEIAVTPANPDFVYLLASNANDNGFLAVYRSTDTGQSFQLRADSPNLLGWSSAGTDSGGQGWYDLAIAASETNAHEIFVGGVNIWRSVDGGSNWDINAHWWGDNAPYVHADIHDLIFVPGSGNVLYSANDGGVFRTTNNGATWVDLSDGLEIAQLYRLGASATNPELVLSGWQDNGTNRLNNNEWQRVIGGDGMECIIDYTNPNIMYGSLYYGNIRRSTNGGNNFSTIVTFDEDTGVNSRGLWVTPYIIHPSDPATLLIGKDRLYRTNDYGNSWSPLGNMPGSGLVRAIAYAPSNPNIIYASRASTLLVSRDAGQSFQIISQELPNQTITSIAVSNIDPNRVYVSFSGYNPDNKVFVTSNGGNSWANLTSGLPNLPVNHVLYTFASNNAIYAATDVGVYYRDDNQASWIPFFNGLPNVVVNELEIHYPTRKLRAATYGRGLWESDLYGELPTAPLADFNWTQTNNCVGNPITITNLTANGVMQWAWEAEGNPLFDPTLYNPQFTWAQPGTYAVTLYVFNEGGEDVITKHIEVLPQPNVVIQPAAPQVCLGDAVTLTASGANNFFWSNNLGPGESKTLTPTLTRTFTVTGFSSGCQHTNTVTVTVLPRPEVSLDASTDQICEGETITFTAEGGITYQWSLGGMTEELAELSPTVSGPIVVVGFNAEGCADTASLDIVVFPLPVITLTPENPSLCEGESIVLSASGAQSYIWSDNLGNDPSIELTPPTSLTLSVQGESVEGCVRSRIVDIIVHPLPEVTLMVNEDTFCEGDDIQLTASGAVTYQWQDLPGTGASQTVSALESRSFLVEGFNEFGCSDEASIAVTVIPVKGRLNYWPEAACPSSFFQLTLEGDAQLLEYGIPPGWIVDVQAAPHVFQVHQAGTAPLAVRIGQDAQSCVLRLDPALIPTTSAPLSYYTCSQSFTPDAECAEGGIWYVIDRETGILETFAAEEVNGLPVLQRNFAARYIVLYKCGAGCRDWIGPDVQFISDLTPCEREPGEDADDLFGIRVQPNPASDLMTLRIQHASSPSIHIRITDVKGRLALEQKRPHAGGILDLTYEVSAWPPGMYLLTVRDHTGRSLQEKLVIH
jgi:photosystem II stability/assembly factor-like uncharacterized protein